MTEYIIRNNTVLKNCIHHLGNLHPDKMWSVKIEQYSPKRTNPQNAYYWTIITIIGDTLGYTKDEMHEAFASKFIGMAERTTIYGQKIIEPVSTTKLTTKEFGEYVDKIQAFAMTEGIVLPQPEYYGVEK